MSQSRIIRACLSLGIVFTVGLWRLPGGGTPAQARSLETIQQTGEIRFCIADFHPAIAIAEPSGCRDDCTFKGPVYEAALDFALTLGSDIKAKFVRVEWDEQFHNQDGETDRQGSYTPELLASGTCDIYPSHLTKLDWRLKKLDFVTLFPNRIMVVVNKQKKRDFSKPEDLAGKVAAVTKDTSFDTWLQAQNESAYKDDPIELRYMSSFDAIKAVEAGEADFTLLDGDLAIWTINRQFKQTALGFPVGSPDEIGWAFRKEDKDLQHLVERYFAVERKASYSKTNTRWKRIYGLSLQDFIKLVATFH